MRITAPTFATPLEPFEYGVLNNYLATNTATYFFKVSYKEVILRNPKNGRFFRDRVVSMIVFLKC